MAVSGQYLDGYLLAVPEDAKAFYITTAEKFYKVMSKLGMLDYVESWGHDLPEGEITSFQRAVKCEDDENIVFSFTTWPDKATRDAAWEKMQDDPLLKYMTPENMPFDTQRIIMGGFDIVFNA